MVFHRCVTHRFALSLLALAAITPTVTTVADGPSFQGIGFLPGTDRSEAYGVSDDGSTVTGWGMTPTPLEALLWMDDGGLMGMGMLRHWDNSEGLGISGDGQAVTGNASFIVGTGAPFRWTSKTGYVELPQLKGLPFVTAQTISSDGNIVVGYSRDPFGTGDEVATLWQADGTPIGLGDLPGGNFRSRAFGVNHDGAIVVGYGTTLADGLSHEAVLWRKGEDIVALGFIPDFAGNTDAVAVSDDGNVVVGYANQGFLQQAFRWTPENGMVGLGYIPGFSSTSEALDVSADGSVIVGRSSSGDTRIAFVWDEEHGMRDLRDILIELSGGEDLMKGWIGMQANDISPNGLSIAGFGTDPNGLRQGWVATLGSQCVWDLDDSGAVGTSDLIALLGAWGDPYDTADLIELLGNWGPCGR